MLQVADYSIITDDWVLEAKQDTVDFNVPNNIRTQGRSILGFMLDADSVIGMTLTIRINGTKVWTWTASSRGNRPVRFFQEVIPAGLIKAGKNVFSFDSSCGSATLVRLSDVVVWWQAEI